MRILPLDDMTQTQPPPPPTQTKAASRQRITPPKILILFVVTVLVAASGFLVFRYYQVSKVRSAIEPLVHNVTLRASNEIKYDLEPSKVTYKELFEKIDKDLAEIESKKIDIQTVPSRFGEDAIAASLNYMNSCQGLLRALESKYYKQLALSTSTGWNKKVEEFNRSVDDVSTAIKETEPTRTALARFFPTS